MRTTYCASLVLCVCRLLYAAALAFSFRASSSTTACMAACTTGFCSEACVGEYTVCKCASEKAVLGEQCCNALDGTVERATRAHDKLLRTCVLAHLHIAYLRTR